MIQNKWSIISIIIVLATVMVINLRTQPWNSNTGVFKSDVNQYYAYLPSIFIYHDLTLQFYLENRNAIGATFFPQRSPTWELAIVPTYGISLLYLPFFLAGHLYALLFGYPANGMSVPYQFAIQMSSWFFLMIGLIFMRKLLKKYFDDVAIAIAILVTVIGTNFLWYVTGEAAMSHVYSFSLISMFLFLLDRWLEKPALHTSLWLGLMVGLITLIRPTNAVIGILAMLWGVSSFKGIKIRTMFFATNWLMITLIAVMVLLIWLPQLLYWKMIAGKFFYYSYPEDQNFFFNNPQLFSNLFSWRKGWLIYFPVMIFALAHIGILTKKMKGFFWPVLIYFLITWYILSSWWNWGFGGGLSIRPYIDSYAVFAFPMAAFIFWALRQKRVVALGVMLVFWFTVWTGTHNNARYFNGSLHWEGNTRQTYLDTFFSLKPKPDFRNTIRMPNDSLAKKGIHKLEPVVPVKD